MDFFEWIVTAFEAVIHILDFMAYFIQEYIFKPENFVQAFLYSMAHVLLWVSWQALQVAHTMAIEFLNSFNYTENAEAAWGLLPGESQAILTYCRVPEAVSIIISALGTKFSLKFVPFARF